MSYPNMIVLIKKTTLLSVALAALPAAVSSLDNGLARTPQMGFSTWNAYACDIDANVIEEAAQALVDEGFRDFGYNYVNIDDCWQAAERDADTKRLQADSTKFPDGLKTVVDKIHRHDLKAGIYSSAGTMTCGHKVGSLDYEKEDAEMYAEAGFDLLKVSSIKKGMVRLKL